MRRVIVGALPLLGLLVLVVFVGGRARDSVSATPGSNANVVLLSDGAPAIPAAEVPSLAGTRHVSTPADLYRTIRPGDVIVIDKNLFPQVDRAFLRMALMNGLPIVALNVPERDLWEASGYVDAVSARNPMMRAYMRPAAPFSTPFYSFVWISRPDPRGTWWNGDGQKDLVLGYLAATLREYGLRAQGLTQRAGGKIVPLDQPQPITR